jgi:hypothetical protein
VRQRTDIETVTIWKPSGQGQKTAIGPPDHLMSPDRLNALVDVGREMLKRVIILRDDDRGWDAL